MAWPSIASPVPGVPAPFIDAPRTRPPSPRSCSQAYGQADPYHRPHDDPSSSPAFPGFFVSRPRGPPLSVPCSFHQALREVHPSIVAIMPGAESGALLADRLSSIFGTRTSALELASLPLSGHCVGEKVRTGKAEVGRVVVTSR